MDPAASVIKEGWADRVEGLAPLLGVIPKDDLADYGFENEEQLRAVELEEPFQLHTVTSAALGAADQEAPLAALVATQTWYFPLSAGGQVRSLLITTREGDAYRAVGIGRAQLARELGRARAQWPAGEGHRLKLVSVLQAATQAEFVLRAGGSEGSGLAPLDSARRVLGESADRSATPVLRVLEPRDVLARLRAVAESDQAEYTRLGPPPAIRPAVPAIEPSPEDLAPRALYIELGRANVSELPKRKQEMSNWCWATMVQAMLARHDIILDQCYLVQWALDEKSANNKNACGDPQHTNFTETGVGSHEMMLNWGVPGSIYPRALAWSEIKNHIESGNPIVRFIVWDGGKHYTIVRGYSDVVFDGNRTRSVNIMDPGCGDYVTLKYETAVDDGTVTWEESRATEFVNQSYSQGVIGYRDASRPRIYAFVLGTDLQLHVSYWDGSAWKWADQDAPQQTAGIGNPAVITYRDNGSQRIYVFATGLNGKLFVNYWDGGQWQWVGQGSPAGVGMKGPSVVVCKQDYPDYFQGNAPRIYCFLKGSDGHLYVNYWDGSIWQWANQGTPPGAELQQNPAAITFRQHKVTQIHVFVGATNGHLCANYWDGAAWHWSDQGMPPGAKVASRPNVITYKEEDQVKIYVFVKGDNGRLYVNYFDGSWHWADQGKPADATVSRLSPGVITFRKDDRQRIYAFVTGDNGHLYVNYWDGEAWHWSDQGTPPGTLVAEATWSAHPGVLTYRDGNIHKIYAFVMGNNNRLYVRHWNGSQWAWRDQSP